MEGVLDFFTPREEEYIYDEATLCALDFETTGLYPGTDEIIEAGAYRFRRGREVARFTTFIRPSIPIPPSSTAVHGIDDQMVADAPLLHDVLPVLLDFLGESIIVAHNVKFDLSFLAAACRQGNRKMPGGLCLDTCTFARNVLKDEKGYSLQGLNKRYGLVSGDAHRALDDARTSAVLLDMIVGRIPGGSGMSMKKLIQLSRTRQFSDNKRT